MIPISRVYQDRTAMGFIRSRTHPSQATEAGSRSRPHLVVNLISLLPGKTLVGTTTLDLEKV